MATKEELLEQALRLPAGQQAELVDELLAHLDVGETDVDAEAAWVAEIQRRSDEVASGKADLVDAGPVLRDFGAQAKKQAWVEAALAAGAASGHAAPGVFKRLTARRGRR
jgi:hypothetical protein